MRIFYIDFFRFLAIISMIIYHCLFDLKYIFSFDIPWFSIEKWYYFQQYICTSFIFLSGISANISKKLLKNSAILFVLSIIITIITTTISKEIAIYFGILHFLALSMFFVYLFSKNLKKLNSKIMLTLNTIVFMLIKSKIFSENKIFINIYNYIKDFRYAFIFGFYDEKFQSADYFPFFPWIFLFLAGYYFYNLNIKGINDYKINKKMKIVEIVSKNSLIIYILHQVVLYFVISIIVKFK